MRTNKKQVIVVMTLAILLGGSMPIVHAALLNGEEIGINGETRSDNYDMLLEDFFSNEHIVTTIGNVMWVPWFSTSSDAKASDLQNGYGCNSGQTIDFTHNCMVSDEFSQVGIIVAMGDNQERMNQFRNTVLATKSTNGDIPAWRIYRDGNNIQPCRNNINGNCDTASDATARIIIALYTAANNERFTDETQKLAYAQLATDLSDDMLEYEVDNTCRPTDRGTVCHWLAGGSEVKRGGFGSTNYAYTGYYPDAIIAMVFAYAHTGDQRYADAASDFTSNYLQAAEFDGERFTAPPGMAFKWVLDGQGIPRAECTNSCGPLQWDSHDAPRALGMCQAHYYAQQANVELPGLDAYCASLNKHMGNPDSAPLQFEPDGTPHNFQSGVFAQGLQSLHQSGANPELYKATIDNALRRYSTQTKSFDWQPAFGVYTNTIAVRSLGMGLGLDHAAVSGVAQTLPPQEPEVPPGPGDFEEPQPSQGIASFSTSCTVGDMECTLHSDATSGACRAIVWSTPAGNIHVLGCEKEGGFAELYRQSEPAGISYETCLGAGCVTDYSGFDRFAMSDSVQTPPPVPQPEPEPEPQPVEHISQLAATCQTSETQCSLRSDATEGVCRTLVWSTTNGDVRVLACEKGNGFAEIYSQERPAGTFSACLGTGCVSEYSGFDRFTMSDSVQTPPPTQEPEPTPEPENEVEEPTVPSNGIGSLSTSCTVNGVQCSLRSDNTDGSCRSVEWSTATGDVKLLGCEKGGDVVEVYRQSSVSGFKACIGSGCVDDDRGFARFEQ